MASIETRGVDRIPESERTSTPWTYAAIVIGSNFSLGIVVFGWLAISLGLSFWSALTSLVVGVTVGMPFIFPLILIGYRTATNNSTASGAYFGVRGRLIGSVIGLLVSIAIAAITIWTAADIVIAALSRFFGITDGTYLRATIYAIITAASAVLVVYGYQLMVRLEKALAVVGIIMIALLVPAFGAHFNVSYAGTGDFGDGGFWGAWITSTVVVGVAGPIFFVTVLGDWSRYISPAKYSVRQFLPIAAISIWLSQLIPPAFGLLVVTAFSDPAGEFGNSIINDSPLWFAVLLLPFALLGGVGQSAPSMYSSGLDLDAIAPRITRAQATAATSAVTFVLIVVGSFEQSAHDSISAISVWVVAIATPWAVITAIGYLRDRGQYDLDALQVFNRGERGGRYWFSSGWNFTAVIAWFTGSVVGILASITSVYTGPIAELFDGLDFSFVLSAAAAAVVYLALGLFFPTPSFPQASAISE